MPWRDVRDDASECEAELRYFVFGLKAEACDSRGWVARNDALAVILLAIWSLGPLGVGGVFRKCRCHK